MENQGILQYSEPISIWSIILDKEFCRYLKLFLPDVKAPGPRPDQDTMFEVQAYKYCNK